MLRKEVKSEAHRRPESLGGDVPLWREGNEVRQGGAGRLRLRCQNGVQRRVRLVAVDHGCVDESLHAVLVRDVAGIASRQLSITTMRTRGEEEKRSPTSRATPRHRMVCGPASKTTASRLVCRQLVRLDPWNVRSVDLKLTLPLGLV